MNFQKDKIYYIKFYDHCTGSDEEMICEVVGWAQENKKNSVSLAYWVVDTDDKIVKKENAGLVNIIKSTIIKKRKIQV